MPERSDISPVLLPIIFESPRSGENISEGSAVPKTDSTIAASVMKTTAVAETGRYNGPIELFSLCKREKESSIPIGKKARKN